MEPCTDGAPLVLKSELRQTLNSEGLALMGRTDFNISTVRRTGCIGFIGLVGPFGFIGLFGFSGLIGFIGFSRARSLFAHGMQTSASFNSWLGFVRLCPSGHHHTALLKALPSSGNDEDSNLRRTEPQHVQQSAMTCASVPEMPMLGESDSGFNTRQAYAWLGQAAAKLLYCYTNCDCHDVHHGIVGLRPSLMDARLILCSSAGFTGYGCP